MLSEQGRIKIKYTSFARKI